LKISMSIRALCSAALLSLATFLALAVAPPTAAARGWVTRSAPAPRRSRDDVLMGVTCVAAERCIAVGGPDDSPGRVLVEVWDGVRWSIQPAPEPAGTEQGLLRSVSCTSDNFCVAAGAAANHAGSWAALVERWDGRRWSFARAPAPAGSAQGALSSVTCTSPSACVAVGSYENRAGVSFPLIDRWNGERWSVQGAAHLPYGELSAVACTSTYACIAVGASVASELIERWNGTRWSPGIAPQSKSGATDLQGIACTSADACTAVGESVVTDEATLPFVDRWNGNRWVNQRPVMRQLGDLYAVSCGARDVCTAVGEAALIERWNGNRWSIGQEANWEAPEESLYGVDCFAARMCVAVGSRVNGAGAEVPLVETVG
jgi:hypothetical protein